MILNDETDLGKCKPVRRITTLRFGLLVLNPVWRNLNGFLQPPCSWSAHQDNWSQGKNCWCCQEEELKCNVLLIVIKNSMITSLVGVLSLFLLKPDPSGRHLSLSGSFIHPRSDSEYSILSLAHLSLARDLCTFYTHIIPFWYILVAYQMRVWSSHGIDFGHWQD